VLSSEAASTLKDFMNFFYPSGTAKMSDKSKEADENLIPNAVVRLLPQGSKTFLEITIDTKLYYALYDVRDVRDEKSNTSNNPVPSDVAGTDGGQAPGTSDVLQGC